MIIKPSEAPRFTWLALGGLALQWALTLPGAIFGAGGHVGPAGSFDDVAYGLGRWWTSWGLGAFWWPGLLVVLAIIAAWIRDRWPDREEWTPASVLDPDRINRPLLALGLTVWAAYMVFLLTAPLLVQRLPGALPAVFAFDDDFLRARAIWLFPVWLCDYAAHVAVFLRGRWTRAARAWSRIAAFGLCALLAWFVAAGPIFQAKATDDATRAILGILVVFIVIRLGLKTYREFGSARAPLGA